MGNLQLFCNIIDIDGRYFNIYLHVYMAGGHFAETVSDVHGDGRGVPGRGDSRQRAGKDRDRSFRRHRAENCGQLYRPADRRHQRPHLRRHQIPSGFQQVRHSRWVTHVTCRYTCIYIIIIIIHYMIRQRMHTRTENHRNICS